MKFSSIKEGQLSLIFSLCVLITSCNPEEYYPVEEIIVGADAYCSKATDLYSCQQLVDICQPAYEPLEIDISEPVFSTCVANPDMWSPAYENPGEEPGPEEPAPAPTIDQVIATSCEDLDPRYLWVKNDVQNKKVIKTTKKVKICHLTGNSQSHTFVIACEALKAHQGHHDDYPGACTF